MRHTLPNAPQFYVTAPQPCPYLPGQVERKLFTSLSGQHAEALNDSLSHQGFRRSQNVLYRPSCAGCSACMSARIPVGLFKPSRSQRKVLARNSHLTRVTKSAWATDEQFELFTRYLSTRHADGGMAGMDAYEYSAMVEESAISSRLVEYINPISGQLIAACLTDILSDGLSMVYSFYDPDYERDSLGSWMILDHINLAAEAGLKYIYLGYWVPGSPKMQYKARFAPLEVFRSGAWHQLNDPKKFERGSTHNESDPIAEQLAAIHLPRGDFYTG
jgi:arginyl-tRNA--protein-N-Asp/Glu arginylyltransferase